jgi:hypothetical protein
MGFMKFMDIIGVIDSMGVMAVVGIMVEERGLAWVQRVARASRVS